MKTIAFIFGIVLFSFTARSQCQFGIQAGLNVANQLKTISIPQVPTSSQDTKPYAAYQFGVFYKTKLNKRFSLAAETNFSVIGSSMTLVAPDGKSYETHEKLGYIELPLTIQYSINKLYFGAGPSIGFKVFSKLKNFENRTYEIPYYQTLDAAGNLLAGYRINSKLDLNLRYSHGLMNIYKDPGHAKTTNRFLNFSVLYVLK